MSRRARSALAAALLLTAAVGAGVLVAVRSGRLPIAAPDRISGDALALRVGGPVQAFDARFGSGATPTGPLRRIYTLPSWRLLLDVTPDGRVRQITIGHERTTNETFTPDPVDWALPDAQQLSREWLPRDAVPAGVEPFVFRGEVAGTRELFDSPALARVFPAVLYAQYNMLGPSGRCAVTYYRTTSGGVAFFLIGIV